MTKSDWVVSGAPIAKAGPLHLAAGYVPVGLGVGLACVCGWRSAAAASRSAAWSAATTTHGWSPLRCTACGLTESDEGHQVLDYAGYAVLGELVLLDASSEAADCFGQADKLDDDAGDTREAGELLLCPACRFAPQGENVESNLAGAKLAHQALVVEEKGWVADLFALLEDPPCGAPVAAQWTRSQVDWSGAV